MSLTKRERRKLRKSGVFQNNEHNVYKLADIQPKTHNQELTFREYENGKHLLLHGSAGTGKTFLSLFLALREILSKSSRYKNITLIRSVVSTRDIGFLPGKEEEKISRYEDPYRLICSEILNHKNAYDILKERGIIDFVSTSFLRGITFNDSILIVDETQNMTGHELSSVITRIGDNCRVLFCGDYRQSDLKLQNDRSGLKLFMNVIKQLKEFSHIEYTCDDIVRSKLVKDFICKCEENGISF